MNNALVVINETTGVPTTTSLMVAEVFGKRHDNLLRDIEKMECSPSFSHLNFEASVYPKRGKSYKTYNMTKDGFTFLAMGFTGPMAKVYDNFRRDKTHDSLTLTASFEL